MAKKQTKKKTPAQGLVDELEAKKKKATGIIGKLYDWNERMKGKKKKTAPPKSSRRSRAGY